MILQKIVENRREEVARQKEILPPGELRRMLVDRLPARDFEKALREKRCTVIAEVKRSSPSRGRIREDFDPVGIARTCEENGAAAVSILTESRFFEGRDYYVPLIRRAVSLPLLRKDFIIDSYQIGESRMLGADALLLIARILEEGQLSEFVGRASDVGIAALVEVHDESDVDKAVSAGAKMIGINNRDLETFRTSRDVTVRLARLIPKGITVVSASGIESRADVETLMDAGVHAFLVGESLMREKDIGKKMRELLGGNQGRGLGAEG